MGSAAHAQVVTLSDTRPGVVTASSALTLGPNASVAGSPTERRVVTTFLGDGRRLGNYGAYYLQTLSTGGNGDYPFWIGLEFDLKFYSGGSAQFQSAPLLLNPGPSDRAVTLDVPGNANWDTPVFVAFGRSYFYFEWDLSALDISLGTGTEHAITVVPRPNGSSGVPFIGLAVPNPGNVNESADWVYINGSGNNPQTLQASGRAGPFAASLVTSVPNPAACPADFNGVGGLSVQDIFDFLAAYFASDPRADFNNSGLPATVQDIFDFLAAYFAGCS